MEMKVKQSCAVCNELEELTTTIHTDSPVLVLEAADLHRNVRQGCSFCRLVYCAITAFAGNRSIPENGVYVQLGQYPVSESVGTGEDSGRSLKLEAFFADYDGLSLEIFCLQGSPTLWPSIGPARSVSQNSSSEQCRKLAVEWLQDCKTNHPRCHSPLPQLPTRVIDVGSESKTPFLHVANGDNAEYVALSHCWGGVVPLRTLASTLQKRLDGIPLDTLPPTFRDAIMITRFLRIQYLWIDSLCIIQDSAEDWNREAATMGSVYCNATVTIAADGAVNGKAGCFRDLAGHGNTLALDCPAPDGTQTKVFVRPCASSTNEELQFDEICHSFLQHGPQSSLDNRAWVLQERLLSRRILHYTNLELAWECDIAHHCECSLSTKASNFRHTVLAGNLKKALQRPRQEPSKDLASLRESPFDWALIVQNFTARSLTQPRDRLPALSGMAELRSLLTGDKYVCGLWKRNISKWLWWKPAESSHDSRRLEPYYAPTWSWASVTGSIWYQASAWNGDDGVERFSLLQDVSIEVEPATSSQYGAAKSGSLGVTGGGLTPCYVSFGFTHDPRPPKRPVMPLKHPELGAEVESKTGQRRIITWEPDVFFEEETPGSSSHLEVGRWSFEIEDGGQLFLFPTIRLVGVRGLVLEPVVGSAGEYRRVGSFWDSAEEFEDLLEPDNETIVIV